MDVQEIGSQLLYTAEHVKYRTSGPGKSPIGALMIYENRVEWSAPNYTEKLLVPFSRIRNQRISPPNKPRVQLQLCMDNDDQATFVFMNPNASQEKLQEERNTVREILQNALIAHRKLMNQIAAKAEKSGNQELVIKQKILEENSHLRSLYLHLVKEKLISPQDFWTFHYKANDSSSKIDNVGISNGFLSSIEQSQGINGVKLSLTVDVINAIFRTYPAVEQKHLELVPHEMKEEEFWSKFFQSHYFHRERNTGEFSANDPFADCAKVDEKDMRDIVNKGINELKRQRNLSYLEEDLGILSGMRDNQMSFKSSKAKAMLVRRCNYHSERVLSTIQGASTSGNSSKIESNQDSGTFDMELDSQELEEMQHDSPEPVATFSSSSSSNDSARNRYKPYEANRFKTIVQRNCMNGSIFDERIKTSFFDTITSVILAESDSANNINCFTGLDAKVIEEIRTVHACLAELLRHFWSCFPPITPELEEKMTRMFDTLQTFENKQLRNCEQQYGTFYVEHCYEMLNKAKERFNSFLKVKKQRRK